MNFPLSHCRRALCGLLLALPLLLSAPGFCAAPDSAPPASPPGVSPSIPPARLLLYDARGKVSGLSYSAKASLQWQIEGHSYALQQQASVPLLGKRIQTSTGETSAGGLLPDRFVDEGRKTRITEFDHAQQRIRFVTQGGDDALQPGAQDRVSIYVQLAAVLSQVPGQDVAGHSIRAQVASTNKTEIWMFTVAGQDTLDLPIGKTTAWRLERTVENSRHPKKGAIWLAPSLDWMPVRIRLEDDGDSVDLMLRETRAP